MATKKEQTKTTQDSIRPGATWTTERWTIEVGNRSWKLSATRYNDGDGKKSPAYWNIQENGKRGDGDLGIATDRDDTNPTVEINWPSKGPKTIAEATAFNEAIAEAIEAATEAQATIDIETANEAIAEAEQYTK